MSASETTGEDAPTIPPGPGTGGRPWRRLGLAAVGSLAVVALAILAWPGPDPEQVWREAQAALKRGDFDAAERASDRLASLRAPTATDLMLRAQVAIARERVDEALEILREFPEDDPMAAQAKMLAGQLELRRDRLRAAEERFREALELDPGLSQVRRELIFIYGYQSKSDAIEEQFRGLADSGPVSAKDAFLWSLIRGVQWTPEEIVERLSSAVERDPGDRTSRIALADALMELNRFDEAGRLLEPLDPSDPDSRAALGRLAFERGDVVALRDLLADAPSEHAGLALLRGKLALRLREPEEAIDAYRTVLELRNNDRDALSGLSQALNQAGRREEANEVVERLNRVTALNNLLNNLVKVDADPAPSQYLEIGRTCEAIGFEAQARAWYQAALARDPFNRQAQDALAGLGRTEPAGEVSSGP
ncbi:tetratricopeptide repeat protein [Tautonia plasticadhaerens]|uniref:Tetratricopeptide repeat protein n=1 Tax=Tautonia plasticadhaerens TaxID=2527974 RepID=A0A518H8S9_9BACT|nr:tetratricopeptide repeat protein [Tautonia plasticadhaerens]QDV37244.1 Tetratricopeptide repeat protein [Tautonia plasticadhaerens]